jgi:predicted nucleotidyltransferase
VTTHTHDRSHILALLQQHRQTVAQRFGVQEIALFGSAARDELRADSDVDVLVGFDGPASYDSYFGLKDYLEQVLGRQVDVVTQGGLKPRARRLVELDLIRVA